MTTQLDRMDTRQVLYVEGQPHNATLMRTLCGLRPHLQLLVAEDGARASAMAPWLNPSLLLLEQRLPDCLGSELLALLRLRFGWDHVPAIAVTGETEFAASRGVFAAVWSKPLDTRVVLRGLDHWLPDTGDARSAPPRPAPRSARGAARPQKHDAG